jgi:hypothetical protein
MRNSLGTEGVRSVSPMPPRLCTKVSPDALGLEGALPTTPAINTPSSATTPATQRKVACQPIAAAAKPNGAVAISVPILPRPSCNPASGVKR